MNGYKELSHTRAKLNHDFLQNRYLTFLAARQEMLDDPRTATSGDLIKRLKEWEEKKPDFVKLVEGVEEALSPRQLLYQTPLDSLSEEHKSWLGPLVHELYCTRTKIKEKAVALKVKIEEVDKLVTAIIKGQGIKDAGKMLYQACRDLSEGISSLPSQIQVI